MVHNGLAFIANAISEYIKTHSNRKRSIFYNNTEKSQKPSPLGALVSKNLHDLIAVKEQVNSLRATQKNTDEYMISHYKYLT